MNRRSHRNRNRYRPGRIVRSLGRRSFDQIHKAWPSLGRDQDGVDDLERHLLEDVGGRHGGGEALLLAGLELFDEVLRQAEGLEGALSHGRLQRIVDEHDLRCF